MFALNTKEKLKSRNKIPTVRKNMLNSIKMLKKEEKWKGAQEQVKTYRR